MGQRAPVPRAFQLTPAFRLERLTEKLRNFLIRGFDWIIRQMGIAFRRGGFLVAKKFADQR
jgi:hypothetical protein